MKGKRCVMVRVVCNGGVSVVCKGHGDVYQQDKGKRWFAVEVVCTLSVSIMLSGRGKSGVQWNGKG